MIARIGSAIRRAGRIAVERPRHAVWTTAAVAAALFAAGAAGLAADNVARWTSVPRGGASMVIYLGEQVDPAHAQVLTAELGRMPGVEHVELVGAVESAARLQQALGADAALLDGVDVASLPASVEVTLAPGVRDVVAMSPTVRALRRTPGIDDVVVEDGGEDRIAGTLQAVRIGGWTAAAVLAGLATIIVLAMIRVRFVRTKQEHDTLHLLGAMPAFTIVPAALAGALQGIAAAVIATIALWIGVALYGDAIVRALSGALGSIQLAMPALPQLVLFIALGGVLGLAGGALAGKPRVAR